MLQDQVLKPKIYSRIDDKTESLLNGGNKHKMPARFCLTTFYQLFSFRLHLHITKYTRKKVRANIINNKNKNKRLATEWPKVEVDFGEITRAAKA